MKVLFCTNAFEKVSNGPAKFAHLLLEESKTSNIEIRILTEEVSVGTPSVYKLNLDIPKPFRLFGQFIRMWKYHRAAMRTRKEYDFDVLVYNNAMIGLLSSIFFRRTVGMINDYSNADNSLFAVITKKATLSKRLIFFYVEYITCHLSKCVVVNSEYLKNELARHYHCKPSLFKVLHKGIENELVTFDRASVLQKKIKGSILFVKTDFVLGGLYTLIDALKNIDREVTLSIVGPALQHHEMLKRLLNDAQIRYELFEYMPPKQVYEKMKESEIFCVPSKREAFGVANIEAMAMGCKIVSTDVGGIPEAVGGNRLAWLVRQDDGVALEEAIKSALDSSLEDDLDDIKSHLGQFSSEKVVSNFTKILQDCF